VSALPRPGELSERVRLEAAVDSPDGAGGFSRSFEVAGEAWAKITPLAAEPHARAERAGERLRFEVILRRPASPPEGGMRLVWKDRVLEIRAVRPLDPRDRFLVLDCVERR